MRDACRYGHGRKKPTAPARPAEPSGPPRLGSAGFNPCEAGPAPGRTARDSLRDRGRRCPVVTVPRGAGGPRTGRRGRAGMGETRCPEELGPLSRLTRLGGLRSPGGGGKIGPSYLLGALGFPSGGGPPGVHLNTTGRAAPRGRPSRVCPRRRRDRRPSPVVGGGAGMQSAVRRAAPESGPGRDGGVRTDPATTDTAADPPGGVPTPPRRRARPSPVGPPGFLSPPGRRRQPAFGPHIPPLPFTERFS